MSATFRFLKRIGVIVFGLFLIGVGIIGVALPVLPGIVLIIAGLAVLGTEFERPRRWVAHLRDRFNPKRSKAAEPTPSPPAGSTPADAD